MMNRFPPGHRFHPTDTELVSYLFKKTMGIKPLPCEGFVSECDLYGEKEPSEIFEGTSEKFHYVFTSLKKQKKTGKRFERTVGTGTWKGVDSSLPVYDRRGNVVGNKRNLVYLTRDKVKGGWNMVEYRFDSITQKYAIKRGKDRDYVLCRVKKKNKNKNPTGGENMQQEAAATQPERTLPAETTSRPAPNVFELDYLMSIIPPEASSGPEQMYYWQPDELEMDNMRRRLAKATSEPLMGDMAHNNCNDTEEEEEEEEDWQPDEIDELSRLLDS